MKKKKVLSTLLSFVLAFSLSMTALAADLPEVVEESDKQEAVVTSDASQDLDEDNESGQEVEQIGEKEDSGQAMSLEETKKKVEPEANGDVEEQISDKWTVEDFTYTTITQTLNGCDYTRQFQISGPAIAGFSESGEKKLETNKNLVIPSVNDKGEKLVGVAQGAFKEKGIESVKFPEGMMVDYDDTVTNSVTKRGNFIIDYEAFAKNNLTSVTLPKGVIAVMSSAFRNNQLTKVTLPHTIWWIENSSFAYNQLTTVGFPKTCDFQVQIHAFAFSKNNIKSVRLPDYAEVVHKNAFVFNPGMEECPSEAPEKEQSLGGVVYMYTDNPKLAEMERIHHMDRTAESQHSWHQKLIVGDKPAEENEWTAEDFSIEGTTITGLSESGIEKRKENKELVLPDRNADGEYITALADTEEMYGLFATETEKFESVELPARIEVIGKRAFTGNDLSKVREFPSTLKEIGLAAFQNNKLTSVILPDSVTTLGGGAFATNPKLSVISLSKKLTVIPSGAFGCSDAANYMEDLTELTIPEGITKIEQNAFAGNNIKNIVIPSTVTEIGNYAFSTKNYLKDKCTVVLPEGLVKIGSRAFRNKVIEEVELPSTVTGLKNNTFEKEYSDGTEGLTTKVYVNKAQYTDKKNFPDSSYHTYVLKADPNDTVWDAYDFTYATYEESGVSADEVTLYPAHEMEKKVVLNPYFITGLSELGVTKLEKNKDLVIPSEGPDGTKITGIAPRAFYKLGIESVTLPEEVKTTYEGPEGIIADGITERGDFVICSNAFFGNKLTTLQLPEGVLRVGTNAFASNQLTSVTIPQTMWMINATAFSKNQIVTVGFPKTCDFKLNIDKQAFASNQIKAVRLPDRTEKLDRYVFMMNPGMEEVDASAPAVWKKGGVVYMYADASVASESFVDHVGNTGSHLSYAQKLITDEEMPETLQPWSVNDFTYSEDGTAITGLTASGEAKRAVNPEMIMPDKGADGTIITAIADASASTDSYGLFGAENEPVTRIILPKNLESIGQFSLRNCGLEKISFPKTLKTIGASAFQMDNLTEIILPDSVTDVGMGAFASNFAVEKVVLSNNMTTIPSGFLSCSGQIAAEKFTELVIPEKITEIGANAFSGNNLSSIVIPKNVRVIGGSAFAQTQANRSLTKIVLSEGLEEIGRWAFRYAKVTEVELPSTVTTLNKDAFRDCPDTGAVVKLYTSNKEQLESTKTFIAESAYHKTVYNNLVGTGWSYADFIFDGAKVTGWSEQGQKTRLNNKKLVIPQMNPDTGEKVTEIGDSAFKIPDNEVTQLKDSVESPNGMTNVEIPEDVTKIGEKAFEYNSFTEVEFPEGLTEIRTSAFHGNQLKKVVIPDSVMTIGGGAFSENNIVDITLPKDIEKLEPGVFSMNIRLEQVTLPDKLTEIGDMAFAGARLTSLEIPKSVTKIGRKAFHLHHLSELIIPGNVKEIGESAFEGTPKAITLKNLVLEEGVETISSRAFKEGYLESVNLPNSLKSLAADAFENNSGTNNNHIVVCYTENRECLDWPVSDSHIIELQGDWAEDCFIYEGNAITGLSKIGEALVKNNPNITLPEKSDDGTVITEVAAKAFENCGVKSVTLPASLTTIGERAFAGNELTSVKIPDKITSIAKDAFAENAGTVTLEVSNEDVFSKLNNAGLEGVSVKDTSGSFTQPTIPNTPAPVQKVKVTKITLTGISKKIAAGKKVTLAANVSPANADNKAVTWTSSNKKVATVDSKGVVTVKKKTGGKKVKITATAKDGSGVKATYTITSMKGVVKKVKISGAKSVKAGKSLKLKAKVTASKKANKKVVWTSSNTKYAKVSSSGKVTTYKAGKGKKVKITAKATDGSGKKKTVTVKIK